MNAKERLDAFCAGKPVDRLPNLTIVGSVVTRYTGIDLEQYCKDPIAMADAAIAAAKDLHLDYVQIASDLAREAEGYGAVLKYSKTGLPTVVRPALEDIADVDRLTVKRVRDIPRVNDLVSATAYARKACPDIYPMTLVVGPATVAANMRGVRDFLTDCHDRPKCAEKLLRVILETLLDMVRELAAVGAAYIYSADPVASLFSPAIYEKSILPVHNALFAEMKKLGIHGRLHMCGSTETILPYSSTCGAEIIDIDHTTDFTKALAAVKGRCVLNGNIDPIADVYQCDAAHTKAAILRCEEITRGSRALFMPGCELPTATPLENARAIHTALCQIGPR